MSQQQDQDSHLQHEAEHVRPAKKLSVMSYLTILFGAAFLLLLMTYFMQQRTSDAALDHQENIAVSAMKSIEELRSENEAYQKQVAALNAKVIAIERALDAAKGSAKDAQAALDTLQPQYDALNYLNQIRSLYNQREYTAARELVTTANAALTSGGGMEGVLSAIAGTTTETDLELYNPLDAYHSLLEWLNYE